jgi:hypothetical protein
MIIDRAYRIGLCIFLLLAGISCSPGGSGGAATPAPEPIAIPEGRKDRIDAVLKHIRQRDLLTDHGFWTIFHGILGMGPDDAMLLDLTTNKRVKAIDYIASGAPVRGLEFVPLADGLEVTTMPMSVIGQGHQDQFVAEMAEWDLPRDKKFVVNGKNYTFDDFVRQVKARSSLTFNEAEGNPLELTWTIVIISKYYGADFKWTNNRGEKLSVEDMARYELRQPIGEGAACGGTHRLWGLTWAYHLHRQAGGKKEGVWHDIADAIENYKKRAKEYQNPDGSFSTRYLDGPGNEPDSTLRIGTTGHILEWLSLAMTDQELRQPWVEKAADALALMILEKSFESLDGGSLYHAAHGLELYRARLWGKPGSRVLSIPMPPSD